MIIHADGGARPNPGPAAFGFCTSPEKGTFGKIGRATNNEAEYKAVIAASKFFLLQTEERRCTIYTDSQLVVNQINTGWNCKASLLPLKNEVKNLLKQAFYEGRKIQIHKISRTKNMAHSFVDKAFEEQPKAF